MIQNFLVPLDGSKTSAQIVPWVARLAKSFDARIRLVTVVEPAEGVPKGPAPSHTFFRAGPYGEVATLPRDVSGPRDPATGKPPTSEPETAAPRPGTDRAIEEVDDLRQRAFDYLSEYTRILGEHGVTAFVHVAAGDPATEILKAADSLGANVIAMSTRRATALARGILGSVTDRVLHMTDRPVLVVHPSDEDGPAPPESWPEMLIVPLDGSAGSESAVPTALEMCRATGARMLLVRAMPNMMPEQETGLRLERNGEGTEGYAYLDGFAERATGEGVTADTAVYAGDAASRIVELARETPGSMVVMTSRGRSGLQRWMLGSVTDKVVRASGQPVLVLPPVVPEKVEHAGERPARPSEVRE
jgi:nucleotide-binding universal stress UspA family protein